jgi:hypothetical protein
METDTSGFRLSANAPDGQKRFPISRLPLRRDRSINPLLAEEKE